MTSYTPILAIPQVDQAQNNKYLTINDLTGLLEGTLNKLLPSNTTGDLVLTESQYTRYAAFKVLGRAAAFNVTFPNTGGLISVRERIFIVWNADTTYVATVKAATTPGTTVVLQPGQIAFCYQNGVDTVGLWVISAGTSGPYDLGFFVPGLPGDAAIVMEWKATRAFTLATNFVGSKCKVNTNPTATAVFNVRKNGSIIGTVSINTSGVATFATTGSTSWAIDDVLSVTAPTPQDATLADVNIGFLGTRT